MLVVSLEQRVRLLRRRRRAAMIARRRDFPRWAGRPIRLGACGETSGAGRPIDAAVKAFRMYAGREAQAGFLIRAPHEGRDTAMRFIDQRGLWFQSARPMRGAILLSPSV